MTTREQMSQIIKDKEGKLEEQDIAKYLAQVCPMCYDKYRDIEKTEKSLKEGGFNKTSLLSAILKYTDWKTIEFQDVLDEFLIWFENETREPEEINENYILNRITDWGEISLEEILKDKKENSKPIGCDEWFYFQCGTSLNRAQLILEGLGYVMGEKEIYIEGQILSTGLQVSERGNHCRSGFDRLNYYAYSQSIKGVSSPAIVCGKILKKYVFDENNCGEYFIPRCYFKEILDLEILSPDEFQKKYLK